MELRDKIWYNAYHNPGGQGSLLQRLNNLLNSVQLKGAHEVNPGIWSYLPLLRDASSIARGCKVQEMGEAEQDESLCSMKIASPPCI